MIISGLNTGPVFTGFVEEKLISPRLVVNKNMYESKYR